MVNLQPFLNRKEKQGFYLQEQTFPETFYVNEVTVSTFS